MKGAFSFLAAAMMLIVIAIPAGGEESKLREALTFHASFDRHLKADFSRGDPEFYTAITQRPLMKVVKGLKTEPEKIEHQEDSGRFGDCLHFKSTDAPRVFFQAEKNFPFETSDWEGSVSFWLRTTPDEDLKPGYTDPIQITPRSALDACFFFEFGIDDPRPCRLGVFPDKLAWNPEGKPNKEIPIPARPLIEVQDPPFSRDRWTHIVFTFEKFNNGNKEGVARLFLDGQPKGEMTGWKQQFTWDLAKAQIRLGVKFIGGFDELSCFDRALTAAEVQELHELESGVTGLLGEIAAASLREPPFETFDLAVGEIVEGFDAKVKLVSVTEPKGEVWGEIARPEVTVEINGERAILVAGMYRLPVNVGGVQVDCPITGGLKASSHIDHWGLEKDARLRIWPGDAPWIAPGTFGYPVKQQWFASQTWYSNEPVAPRPNGQLYYHAGIDIGGCEALTEVVAATDALVVQVGNKILAGHEPANDTPVAPRYDVLYLLDERGWYYRYSHLHSFDPKIRPGSKVKLGDRLGLLGKEGGSGGWTHLHFEAKAKQPSGEWGTQDTYAFLWQGYRELFDPEIIAVARPSHVIFAGDTVTHDGSRSWSRDGTVTKYAWQFSEGGEADSAVIERKYETPGQFVEVLEVTDSEGNTDYDFVRVMVFDRGAEGIAVQPPRVHATFHPTSDIRAGQPVTFKVRSFRTTHGKETWDFGDGSHPARTRSDGNVEQRAKDGYAIINHAYEKPGDFLVHVWRKNEEGVLAEDRLHVRVIE